MAAFLAARRRADADPATRLGQRELRAPVVDELASAASDALGPMGEAVVKEAQRLYPPASAILRRVRRPVAWAAPGDPFAYLPFGHGGRRRIGEGLARTLLRAFVRRAVPRATWSLLDAEVRPTGTTLLPSGGVRLAWARS